MVGEFECAKAEAALPHSELSRAEDEPEEFAVEEKDGGGNTPGGDDGGAGVDEFAHLGAFAGELNERNHGEGQLKTEYDLAENQKRGELPFPGDADDENRGNNSNGASDQAAQPGLQADIEETFHDDLAGEGAGERRVLPGSEQGTSEKRAGEAGAEGGAEEFVSLGDVGDFAHTAGVKRGGAKNEDCGVDEKRKKESDGGIDDGVAQGVALFLFLLAEGAGLHDAGVQIEIVGHHGGAKDADSDVEHFLVAQDFGVRDEAAGGFAPDWVCVENFIGKAQADAGDKGDNESFDEAEAATLQGEDDEDVEGGEKNAEEKRNVEKEIEGDGGAEDLSEVAGGDSQFAGDPEKNRHAAGIVVAAGLGEVAACDDAELRGKRLEKHRQEIADQDDAKERISEFRAAADVRGPVAGIHVADSDEIAGAGESQDFAKPVGVVGDGDAAVGFGERGERESAAPGGDFGLVGGQGRGGGESLGEDVGHSSCQARLC